MVLPVLFIVSLTLFDPPQWLWFIPEPVVDTVGFRPLEMLLNIALFVPLGLGLGAWWPSRPRLLWGAIVLSVGIELAQLTLPDRHTDPVDVLTNGVGALLGFAVARWIHAARRRE
ncbi:MAG: VanZ family protein [Nitriliruptoraceae bacterium]